VLVFLLNSQIDIGIQIKMEKSERLLSTHLYYMIRFRVFTVNTRLSHYILYTIALD
jgi:hypothetical protein